VGSLRLNWGYQGFGNGWEGRESRSVTENRPWKMPGRFCTKIDMAPGLVSTHPALCVCWLIVHKTTWAKLYSLQALHKQAWSDCILPGGQIPACKWPWLSRSSCLSDPTLLLEDAALGAVGLLDHLLPLQEEPGRNAVWENLIESGRLGTSTNWRPQCSWKG